MPFSDPIVGGNTLIRNAIQSVNYTAGVSGWTINRDGSAEFNDVTVRGDLYVVDPDGSYVHIYDEQPGDGAVIAYRPADRPGYTFGEGQLKTGWNGFQAYASLTSPIQDGGAEALLALYAERSPGAAFSDLSTAALVAGTINLYAGTGSGGAAPIIDIRTLADGTIYIGQDGDTVAGGYTTLQHPVGNRAYVLTTRGAGNCTARLNLAAADAAVAGCGLTLDTNYPNALWECEIVTDQNASGAGFIGVGKLRVDGIDQGQQAIFQGGAGDRATVTQNYGGTIAAAGSHTFAMYGARGSGTAGFFEAQHTTITVRIFE